MADDHLLFFRVAHVLQNNRRKFVYWQIHEGDSLDVADQYWCVHVVDKRKLDKLGTKSLGAYLESEHAKNLQNGIGERWRLRCKCALHQNNMTVARTLLWEDCHLQIQVPGKTLSRDGLWGFIHNTTPRQIAEQLKRELHTSEYEKGLSITVHPEDEEQTSFPLSLHEGDNDATIATLLRRTEWNHSLKVRLVVEAHSDETPSTGKSQMKPREKVKKLLDDLPLAFQGRSEGESQHLVNFLKRRFNANVASEVLESASRPCTATRDC